MKKYPRIPSDIGAIQTAREGNLGIQQLEDQHPRKRKRLKRAERTRRSTHQQALDKIAYWLVSDD